MNEIPLVNIVVVLKDIPITDALWLIDVYLEEIRSAKIDPMKSDVTPWTMSHGPWWEPPRPNEFGTLDWKEQAE